jgi:hypothetical protein
LRDASGRCDLGFFAGAASRHVLEESDGRGLAVNPQLKLLAFQTVNEFALLVENRDIRLDQLGRDAHDIIRLTLRLLVLLARCG